MNKSFLRILGLLFLVVLVSGCTSSGNNTTKFDKDGISFDYPADWSINETSDNNSYELEKNVSDGNIILNIYKKSANSTEDLINEINNRETGAMNVSGNVQIQTFTLNIIEEENTTIDGVPGNMIEYYYILNTGDTTTSNGITKTSSDTAIYGRSYVFVKNGVGYEIKFSRAKGVTNGSANNTTIFDDINSDMKMIIESFQVT